MNPPSLKQKLLELLSNQQRWHPSMQPVDAYKLLYQSVYGPGHLREISLADFEAEYEGIPAEPEQDLLEQISIEGDACRINLSACKGLGIPAVLIFDVVRRSAHVWPRRSYDVPALWRAFKELVEEGALSFDMNAVKKLDEYLARHGFPTLHHSSEYIKCERPSYRVALRRFAEELREAVLTIDTKSLNRFLSRNYGIALREPTHLSDIRKGYMGTTVFLRTDVGRRLLKIYGRNLDSVERMEQRHDFSNFLAAEGLPVPQVFYNRQGKTMAEYEGRAASLIAHADGEKFTPSDMRRLEAAGGILARLHLAGEKWLEEKQVDWESYEEVTLSTATRVLRKIAQVVERDGETVIPPGIVSELLDDAKRLSERFRDQCEWRSFPVMLHGDFRGQNLLFEGEHVTAVLDFDFSRPGASIHDICYALVFFQAVLAPEPLTLVEMEAFARGYSAVRVPQRAELALLQQCLELAFIRGISLWLRMYYLDGFRERVAPWVEAYLPFLELLEESWERIRKFFS